MMGYKSLNSSSGIVRAAIIYNDDLFADVFKSGRNYFFQDQMNGFSFVVDRNNNWESIQGE